MREFKGQLLTHLIPKEDRLLEQKRLKHYLKGDTTFAFKNNLHYVDPYRTDSNYIQEDILPQIEI